MSPYKSINDIKRVRLLTKKELFIELYEECKDKRKRERISFIVSRITQYLSVKKKPARSLKSILNANKEI